MSQTGGSTWLAAIGGGVIGAILVGGGMMAASRSGYGDALVRSALTRHPEILVESADRLRDRQYAPTIAANKMALETPFASSWKGSAKPDVTMVEFYDYACGYCRASLPHIDRLLSEDKGLRVVFRELPILGPDSVAGARLALAASKAGRFAIFHDTLYAAGRPSPETLAIAAKAAGIAPTPPEIPEYEAEIKRNFELAGQLGATGTPLFVIGDRVINAAIGYDGLKKAIADARARS